MNAPEPTPRVLMVSTSYPSDRKDWRGVFIRHLTESLARRNDIELRLWAPPGNVPANVAVATTARERRWLGRLMEAGGIAHLMRQRRLGAIAAPLRLLAMLRAAYRRPPVASLYHVNWLQNALPLPANGTPLLVSVLGTDMQMLRIPLMRQMLRRKFRGRRVAICPNADWMLPTLQRAFGDIASIRVVPFGIDPAWFRVERTALVAAPQKWLCITRLTKGKVGALFEWCRPYFADSHRELHLFGPMQETIEIPPWVKYHGPVTAEQLLEQWFPHAHGLITLSQHAEGRPQVMLEAMAAALPIIATRLPAHTDLVGDGQCGHICDNAEGVGRALDDLGTAGTNLRMGANARSKVAAEIGTWDDCAGRYAAIYHELLETRTS